MAHIKIIGGPRSFKGREYAIPESRAGIETLLWQCIVATGGVHRDTAFFLFLIRGLIKFESIVVYSEQHSGVIIVHSNLNLEYKYNPFSA